MYDDEQDPVIQPQACGWTDDGSGIDFVRYEFYLMQPNTLGQLAELADPVKSFNDYSSLLNGYRFTCPTEGVYSIKMTVFDLAGNFAIVRKLFVYTGNTKMIGSFATFIDILCFVLQFVSVSLS